MKKIIAILSVVMLFSSATFAGESLEQSIYEQEKKLQQTQQKLIELEEDLEYVERHGKKVVVIAVTVAVIGGLIILGGKKMVAGASGTGGILDGLIGRALVGLGFGTVVVDGGYILMKAGDFVQLKIRINLKKKKIEKQLAELQELKDFVEGLE